MEPTNPAGRLHKILLQAQTDVSTGGRNYAAAYLWARVFDISHHPTALSNETIREVIARLMQLQTLIEETEESLHAIKDLPEKFFRPFPRIRPLPYIAIAALNTDVSSNIRSITEGDMTVLEFCSDALDSHHLEPIVDEEELQAIIEDVNALFDEVKTSDLDPELKTFVLDGLEAIRRGIFEYRIRGPKRLKEALAEIIGNIAMNRDTVRAAGNQEVVGKFEKIFYRLAAAVSFAKDSVALLSAVKVALLPGGG